jgi:hypothetical protein
VPSEGSSAAPFVQSGDVYDLKMRLGEVEWLKVGGYLVLLCLSVALSIGASFAAEPGPRGLATSVPLLLAAGLIPVVVAKMTSPGRVRTLAIAMVLIGPMFALTQVVGRQVI